MNPARFFLFLFVISIIIACKNTANPNLNNAAGKTGYLLKYILVNGDSTMTAEYNKSNQLVKLLWQNVIEDSIAYDGDGRVLAFRWILVNKDNGARSVSRVVCDYKEDSVKSAFTRDSFPHYSDIKSYGLRDDKVLSMQTGMVYNGVEAYYAGPAVYSYEGDNVVASVFPFVTPALQPVDSFMHDSRMMNPYRLLGDHVWLLLSDDLLNSYSKSIVLGESQNFPLSEVYTGYGTGNGTTYTSWKYGSEHTIRQVFPDHPELPALLRTVREDESEAMTEFVYEKMK